jgi:hypothetical protein
MLSAHRAVHTSPFARGTQPHLVVRWSSRFGGQLGLVACGARCARLDDENVNERLAFRPQHLLSQPR